MATTDDTSGKQLQLRIKNKLLARIYFAGVNPKEFSRMARMQEVEMMSVSQLCVEVQRCMAASKSKTVKRAIAFTELCYIMAGILFVFKAQVTLLFDQVLQQAHFTMQSSQSVTMSQKQSVFSFTKKRRVSDTIESIPKKRGTFSEPAEFDLQSLVVSDDAVDDESTIQILKTSKVMKRYQISIREVISEPVADLLSQFNGFDAADNGNTENFLQIRECVAKGRSIAHMIQGEGDDEQHDEDGYEYPPLHSPPSNPLPNIDGCVEESEYRENHAGEMTVVNDEADHGRRSSTEASIPSIISSELPSKKPATKGRKRKHEFIDENLQVSVFCNNWNTNKKLLRCSDPRLDCVTKKLMMRDFKLKFFEQPAHAFTALKPRYTKKTVALRMFRMKRSKPKEPNDLKMVEDFLNPEPVNEEQVHEQQQEDRQFADESQENNFTRRRREREELSAERPLPCSETLPEAIVPAELDDSDENMPMTEPEPIYEPQPITEAVSIPKRQRKQQKPELDLPSVNDSPTVERQRTIVTSNVSRNCRIDSAQVPRNVLRLLNQFVTVTTTNEPCKSSSEELFVQQNHQNREKWGLMGVLEKLFRLWYNDTHPISMIELLHPYKQKLAAALAFYSILELNSPRIGLVVIEKFPDSNSVYNIAMSPKLISLLQKKNVN